jgi:hypothetical protein
MQGHPYRCPIPCSMECEDSRLGHLILDIEIDRHVLQEQ